VSFIGWQFHLWGLMKRLTVREGGREMGDADKSVNSIYLSKVSQFSDLSCIFFSKRIGIHARKENEVNLF